MVSGLLPGQACRKQFGILGANIPGGSSFRGSSVMSKKVWGQKKNLYHHHSYMLHAGLAESIKDSVTSYWGPGAEPPKAQLFCLGI